MYFFHSISKTHQYIVYYWQYLTKNGKMGHLFKRFHTSHSWRNPHDEHNIIFLQTIHAIGRKCINLKSIFANTLQRTGKWDKNRTTHGYNWKIDFIGKMSKSQQFIGLLMPRILRCFLFYLALVTAVSVYVLCIFILFSIK